MGPAHIVDPRYMSTLPLAVNELDMCHFKADDFLIMPLFPFLLKTELNAML